MIFFCKKDCRRTFRDLDRNSEYNEEKGELPLGDRLQEGADMLGDEYGWETD